MSNQVETKSPDIKMSKESFKQTILDDYRLVYVNIKKNYN